MQAGVSPFLIRIDLLLAYREFVEFIGHEESSPHGDATSFLFFLRVLVVLFRVFPVEEEHVRLELAIQELEEGDLLENVLQNYHELERGKHARIRAPIRHKRVQILLQLICHEPVRGHEEQEVVREVRPQVQ